MTVGAAMLLALSLAFSEPLCAQSRRMADEFDFMMYLVGGGMKDEAVTLATSLRGNDDSTSFLKGYAFYNARLLDSAASSYIRVNSASPLYSEAMLFAALSNAHLKRYGQADQCLSLLRQCDSSAANLVLFEQAGLRLLERRLDDFDALLRQTDTSDYRLAEEAAQLCRVRRSLGSYRPKSPFVAGALSALVPGLGKAYAGQWGEAIAAFLITGSLMGVTAENWVREGVTNWKTIGAGLLSTVFYVGTIYGSVVTVRANVVDFNNQQDVQILYNIHIPLRSSYRR